MTTPAEDDPILSTTLRTLNRRLKELETERDELRVRVDALVMQEFSAFSSVQESMMVASQARHINRLRDSLTEAQNKCHAAEIKVSELAPAHDYYMMIQKACIEHEAVMSAWQRFIAIMKLALEEEQAGLTCSKKNTNFGPYEKTVYDEEFNPELKKG